MPTGTYICHWKIFPLINIKFVMYTEAFPDPRSTQHLPKYASYTCSAPHCMQSVAREKVS